MTDDILDLVRNTPPEQKRIRSFRDVAVLVRAGTDRVAVVVATDENGKQWRMVPPIDGAKRTFTRTSDGGWSIDVTYDPSPTS